MKAKLLICSLCLAALLPWPAAWGQDNFESLKLINSANWGRLFNELTTSLGDSRGAIQCAPADAFLLARTLPPGGRLTIKPYKLSSNDPPFLPDSLPALVELTEDHDVDKLAALFRSQSAEAVVYPSLGQLIIKLNDKPYARVAIAAGPPEAYYPVRRLPPGQPVVWDDVPALATVPGVYTLLNPSHHYLSGTYYNETLVPFGAWLTKIGGTWAYREGERWFKLPAAIADDLDRPADRRYTYFEVDEAGKTARWGSNIFGRDLCLFTDRTGRVGYPNLIFASGELNYEQTMLAKDLVYLLTVEGPDDFEPCAAGSRDLRGLAAANTAEVDPRVGAALAEYEENRLPRSNPDRRTSLGLYYYGRRPALAAGEERAWLDKIRGNWNFYRRLRASLRADFSAMGIFSLENRQNVLEGWLNDRLAFNQALPPTEAKYVRPLNFSGFFKPSERASVFNEREKAVMLRVLRGAASGEVTGLDLRSVAALNDYNFGRLLNDILGNLYKSHGCLHVSPRHSYFLYELLPAGSRINIHPYGTVVPSDEVGGLPLLADLVNFSDDLEKLKTVFATAEVRVEVYPESGLWLVYIKDRPLAWLAVKGGPKSTYYLMEGRDDRGRPVFEKSLAYPTTPGKFRVLDRVKDYVSKLYYDLTVIPMGALISKEAGGWFFTDREGKRKPLPASVAADLDSPVEARKLTFYREIRNASGELIAARWGSQPFGTYCLRTTADGRTPSPELVHTSGDLIMEERQLINDLILVMSAPYDDVEECIGNSPNFDLYRTCYEFTNNPSKGELLGLPEKANYKLYYDLPLSTAEAAVLPADSRAAEKALKGRPLTAEDKQALIAAGIAALRQGKFELNRPRLYGLSFDIYQYVVTIEKYAHHYATLKQYWNELTGLRQAMLIDFNNFVIKDPGLFHNFLRELMLARTRLARLDKADAARRLDRLVEQGAAD